MISISGGLIVTRASSDSSISSDYKKQFFSKPEPLFLASGALIALSAFSGMPTMPFILLASGVGYGGWRLKQGQLQAQDQPAPAAVSGARFCPNCGQQVAPGAKFCSNCGHNLQTANQCPNCQAINPPGAKFCSNCGCQL